MAYLYKIKSLSQPHKEYYGRTEYSRKRAKQHFYLLGKNEHHSHLLQEHYNEYGKDDLVFEVILEADHQETIRKEQKYINTNPFFNISTNSKGGRGLNPYKLSLMSRAPSDEQIAFIGEGIKNGDIRALTTFFRLSCGNPKKLTQEGRDRFLAKFNTITN